MTNTVLAALASAAAVGLLWWVVARVREVRDRQEVRNWLSANTRDEPGESHVTTEAIAKGTRLPEDRVQRSCMSDTRIYFYEDQQECWSVWRKKPQSVYEKRGMIEV